MANNFETIANDVIKAVGGKENVTNVTHCMTRLRFNVVDDSKVDVDGIRNTKGVMGYVNQGGQHQIIVGQTVDKVYDEVVRQGGFVAQKAIEENVDAPKEKLTFKSAFNNTLNYLSGSLTPLIPLILAAALFRTVQSVLGPQMLGVISETSDLYTVLGMVYNAGFYFMPIYIGYTASKKLGVNPALGMLMGGILIAPELIALANNGVQTLKVYGIPASVANYSQTILPIILSVWVMSYVEKFFNKVIPATLRTIFAPFLTIAVMVPVALCALAPLGNFVGTGIGTALLSLGNVGGFIAVAIIAALWEFLVMSGMHLVLAVTMMTVMFTTGHEGIVSPAACCATFAAFGMALGAALLIKDKEEKSENIGYFIAGFLGGVTEPALYGTGVKYRKPLVGMAIGAALGGLYAGLMHVNVYALTSTNVLMVLGYIGEGTGNLVNGIISCVIAMVGAAVATYLLGIGEKK